MNENEKDELFDITTNDIVEAIRRWDENDNIREELRNPYTKAKNYYIFYNNHLYSSKVIVAIAYEVHFSSFINTTGCILKSQGGKNGNVVALLKQRGFEIVYVKNKAEVEAINSFYNDFENNYKNIENAINNEVVEGLEKEQIIKVRVNQCIFRKSLLIRYEKCCLCDIRDEKLLIASHIKPWAVSAPKERLDVDNGLLLCPDHDKLFDLNYISFDDNGKIIISEALSEVDRKSMNINDDIKIQLTDGNRKYLVEHRSRLI